MKVGFDIDGVILKIDLGLIRAIDMIDDVDKRNEVSKYYYGQRERQLNPLDYMYEDDELFIITGRAPCYKEETKKWVKKYFPMAKLIILGEEEDFANCVLDNWFEKQSIMKAGAIKKYYIEVYFEDTPDIVRRLRELCPKCKIIQYGGRFSI